jgi:branched-subunit amino acid aminotransferase/4-amino-4-deoxychorismate lyase
MPEGAQSEQLVFRVRRARRSGPRKHRAHTARIRTSARVAGLGEQETLVQAAIRVRDGTGLREHADGSRR